MNQIECAAELRLSADAEERTSKNGKLYVRLRGAVGDADAVQWLQINAIGEQAVAAAKQLVKGDRCYIEGSIKLDRWTAQDGTERSGLSVLAWRLLPLAKIGRSKPAQPRQPSQDAPTPNGPPGPSQGSAKRHSQAPGHITDPRPASGPPPHSEIPF